MMDSPKPKSFNGWNPSPSSFRRSSDISISPQQYTPLKDVIGWPPAQVRNWIAGLGPHFHSISSEFQIQQIRGADLLQVGLERLVTLGISNISQQETILEALEQLRAVAGASGDSTLLISQSLSTHLTQLIQRLCSGLSPDKPEDGPPRLSVETFESVHTVLSDLRRLITTIEQLSGPDSPLELPPSLRSWEETMQSLLAQAQTLLSLLSDRDSRERVMAALKACSAISETLTHLFNCFHHPPLSTHRSGYLVVPLPSSPGAKLGLNLKKHRDGKIRISEVVPNSPVAQTELLHVGDEVVRIRDQMVVSWELSSVVRLFSENQSSLSITTRSHGATHANPPRSIILSTGSSPSPLSPHRFLLPSHPDEVELPDALPERDIMRRRGRLDPSTGEELNDLRKPAPLKRAMSLPPQDRIKISGIVSPQPLERRLSDSDIFGDRVSKPSSPISSTSPQAYRTRIIGGVVTRIPINSEAEDKQAKKKKGIGKLFKSISFRNIIQSSGAQVKSPSSQNLKEPADSKLTESYQVRIINGIPHKFPARGTDKGKERDKAFSKEKKSHGSRLRPNASASLFPSSHSADTFNQDKMSSSLQNGFPDTSLDKKSAPFLSSSGNGPSPNLQGKFVHRVASNGEIEVELISEISDSIEPYNLEHIPPELKVPYTSIRDPDCTGWLTKQGGTGITPKNWRKRWFALKGDNLYYYKSSFDMYALGRIYVPKYAVDFNLETKKKHSFSLYHPLTRTYYLYADSEEEIQKWVGALSSVSRPTFSTPGRLSSPSSDSLRDGKSRDSQNSAD